MNQIEIPLWKNTIVNKSDATEGFVLTPPLTVQSLSLDTDDIIRLVGMPVLQGYAKKYPDKVKEVPVIVCKAVLNTEYVPLDFTMD